MGRALIAAYPRRSNLRYCADSHAADEPDDQQQNNGPGSRRDDFAEDAGADEDAELTEEPAADEGTDDADDDVAEKTEAAALDDDAGEPTGDGAEQEPNQNRFERHG